MHSNPNSSNPDANAWTFNANRSDYIFMKIHSRIAHHLADVCEAKEESKILKFVTRAHPLDVSKLWSYVHPDKITKEWSVVSDELLKQTRSHSATEFRSAEQFVYFVKRDNRLIWYHSPTKPLVSFFLPMKRFDPSSMCPEGLIDETNILGNQADKIAAYNIWLADVSNKYGNMKFLSSLNNVNIGDLRQLAVFPLKVVYDRNLSFAQFLFPLIHLRLNFVKHMEGAENICWASFFLELAMRRVDSLISSWLAIYFQFLRFL